MSSVKTNLLSISHFFYCQANLVYLARLTDRVAIIPPFIPSHIGGSAGNIDFGAIFNTTRLGEYIGIPVVEWHDVKTRPSGHMDDLGCWSVWEPTQYEEDFPRRTPMLSQLNLGMCPSRLNLELALTVLYH